MADNKPTHEIRFGRLRAAIWENQTQSGNTLYNVTFSRLYTDGKNWKDSTSFGRDDMLLLAKLADAAHTWILQEQNPDLAE